jgi:polar amino acid transport system substrate-binding protein/glutamate/aspartate transport system substrate-binding protein
MFRTALSIALMAALASTAQAQTLERIKETSEIRFGFRTDAPPLSYADAEGRPAGYSPTICGQIGQAIANSLDLEELNATFLPVTAENRFELIASGEIDLLCGAASITLSRQNTVSFSIPTYVDGTAVMLPVGGSSDLRALGGQKIGVRAGTTTQEALTNTLTDAQIDAEVIAFDTHEAGLTAIENGEIKAYFADQSILVFLRALSDRQDELQVMDRLLTVEKHGLAMQRGDVEFQLLIDAVLSEMYRDGRMEAIFTENLPGAEAGLAIRAMFLLAPTLP